MTIRFVVLLCAAAALGGCAGNPPPAPETPATTAPVPPPPREAPVPAPPPDALTLAGAIDHALRHSPETRAAWHDAQAAAARYGAERGAWWPTIDGEGTVAAADEGSGDDVTTWTAGLRLSYLLFDFGGRAGDVEAAKQALVAASWSHSAAVHDRVLAVEAAFLTHAAAQAILEADRTSLAEAESSLAAAAARQDLGLATVADVLQARTALSQVRLEVQTAEGRVRTSRGSLALAMGLPAQTPLAIAVDDIEIPATNVAQDVDQLIVRAVEARPELQAARARAWQLAAEARAARADLLPSLSLGGFAGRTWLEDDTFDRHSAAVVLDIPLFGGLSRRYDARAAAARAAAEAERARRTEQAVVYEVFVAHSDFQTATERVATSADLLASATESERVAAGRYREGVGTVLDLLSAQRALAAARAVAITDRLDWFIALAQLAHHIGSLDPRASGLLAGQE